MKKIIGLVLASLMFVNIGFAGITIIDSIEIKNKYQVSGGHAPKRPFYMYVETLCVDGYIFVTARNGTGSISMVQFYTDQSFHEGRDLPAKC